MKSLLCNQLLMLHLAPYVKVFSHYRFKLDVNIFHPFSKQLLLQSLQQTFALYFNVSSHNWLKLHLSKENPTPDSAQPPNAKRLFNLNRSPQELGCHASPLLTPSVISHRHTIRRIWWNRSVFNCSTLLHCFTLLHTKQDKIKLYPMLYQIRLLSPSQRSIQPYWR